MTRRLEHEVTAAMVFTTKWQATPPSRIGGVDPTPQDGRFIGERRIEFDLTGDAALGLNLPSIVPPFPVRCAVVSAAPTRRHAPGNEGIGWVPDATETVHADT